MPSIFRAHGSLLRGKINKQNYTIDHQIIADMLTSGRAHLPTADVVFLNCEYCMRGKGQGDSGCHLNWATEQIRQIYMTETALDKKGSRWEGVATLVDPKSAVKFTKMANLSKRQ